MSRLLFRLALFLTLSLALLVMAVPLRYNALINPPYPFLLLTQRTCDGPCWMGVIPGQTPRVEIIDAYERVGISHQVVTNQVSGRGIWTINDVHGFHGAVFIDEDDIASEVFLVRYHNCAMDFVEVFGEPDVITRDNRVTLFYSDYGMVVSVGLDETEQPRTGIRIYSARERFERRLNPDEVVTWQSVQAALMQRCN